MKLSFIIPCYNAAATVQRTISSVINQCIEDYEVVVVNDGSKDNTLDVLRNIASEYPNIIVVDKPNGGVSSARNVGLNNSNGDYIFFLDADDELDPLFYKEIYSVLNENKDLYVFSFDSEKSDGSKRHYRNKIKGDLLQSYLSGIIHMHICAMLIKHDIIINNHILFDENTFYSEDIEFMIKCMLYANNYHYIDKELFHYKYNENSAMNVQTYSLKRLTSIYAQERIYNLLRDKPQYLNSVRVFFDLDLILNTRMYLSHPHEDEGIWQTLLNYNRKYLRLAIKPRLNKYNLYVYFWRVVFLINKGFFYRLLA
jgi:glycosyltransferase involved in cell wall biosynthesis